MPASNSTIPARSGVRGNLEQFPIKAPDKSFLRRIHRLASALSCAALTMLLWAAPARAHAFGQRYDLPLPLDFYLAGAGGAVALSFVIVALFSASHFRTAGDQGSTCSAFGQRASSCTRRRSPSFRPALSGSSFWP